MHIFGGFISGAKSLREAPMAKVLTGEQTHVSRDLGNPTPYHPPSLFSHTPPLALIVAIIMGHSQVSSICKTLDRRLSCTKLPLFSGVVAKLGGEQRRLSFSFPDGRGVCARTSMPGGTSSRKRCRLRSPQRGEKRFQRWT